jgi:hypothetical protein
MKCARLGFVGFWLATGHVVHFMVLSATIKAGPGEPSMVGVVQL